jgi:NAD(P)-dependent dehydrogenase (short-subunit alcohol dehydrogenase family)
MPLASSTPTLQGRIALVTGAAAGIGAAIARGFARSGAALALCDRDAGALAAVARELEAGGARVLADVFDVRHGEAARRFVERAATELGSIDVLVNNAGGTFAAPFLELSEKGERALVDENFSQVASLIRAVAPRMPGRGGSIVNVTSIEAHRAAPGYAVYAAMKAAVESLTRSLALELADRRIRMNAIAPDAIATPGLGGTLPPTPLGVGCADDVASAALYLASDLSRFVTGTTLHVDGGEHAAGGWRRGPGGGFAL